MKKTLIVLVVLVALYAVGPHPDAPTLPGPSWTNIPNEPAAITSFLQAKEAQNGNLKPDNEGQIIYADSANPQKTKTVVLYVHGFSASPMEGNPLHKAIAKSLHANLVLARIEDHGEFPTDSTMAKASADKFYQSVENYYALAKKLGDEVIVLGTSFGGAMSLVLATKHPEIKALMLYGPCIAIKDPTAPLVDNPWGLQLARAVMRSDFRDIPSVSSGHKNFWSLHYRLEGVVAIQNFLTHEMTDATFEKVKVPVFLGYYYQDETHQDNVVSVQAMRDMFPKLGSKIKKEQAFPLSGYHVITSDILGKRVDLPIQASLDFIHKL
ncbi:alpha/beta hydrolase [Aquirufa echingensis]|jgi:esterase/lipase|uniref:Alpha/beta hydrolase n=1 Tax=Aquirufa echingensis TaxID=3096516 RepID=A0ABW6CZT5_9BACT